MGLIGPNGSGKTTTIKLILNMLRRSDGQVRILGGTTSPGTAGQGGTGGRV